MTRRNFLQRTGLGSLAAVGASTLPPAMLAAINTAEPMKITQIDAVTFRKDLHIGGGSGGSDGAEFWWVRLHTDKGIVGTGETYPMPTVRSAPSRILRITSLARTRGTSTASGAVSFFNRQCET